MDPQYLAIAISFHNNEKSIRNVIIVSLKVRRKNFCI